LNHSEPLEWPDVSDLGPDFTITNTPPVVASLSQRELFVVLAACSLTLVAVFVALFAISRHWRDPDKGLLSDSVHLMENGHRGNNGQILDHIKLSAVVGQGRYGTVWTGYLENQQVAVKVFPAAYKQYYYNERDIYCLPFMDHPSLLTYFGCSEKMMIEANCAECLLVLSYCPNGCLQDYIRTHVLDFNTFCRMALSIAKGLAFLHTDIRKGDMSKPCVCHRDLNTRNILVKSDLSCCLCDLGLAIKLSGSHYYTLDEEQHAETKSISDVGTLRYMAPEVLEGAVNLRDCESSLKQIDVYALGLVLWELACRCSDFYLPNVESAPYRMPFESEIGQHPTFEQMQVLVTRKKARPLFPEGWHNCAATRLVRETIDDCWDQDAEARLTALCVEERLIELSTIHFKGAGTIGVSPTVNVTHTFMPFPNYNNNNNNNIIESAEDTGDKEGIDSNLSEGTVETLLTLSPSEPCVEALANSKNSNSRASQGLLPLQPYQGRNPCFERNLMWDVNSQHDLIDRSMKHHPHNYSENHSLVNSDYLNPPPRVNTPIPFVQNAVFDNPTIPKQPNVPGNSCSHKQLSTILSRPLKKLLESKKNRSDLSPKSNLRSRPLKETEVSLGDQRTITAILGREKENTSSRSKNHARSKDKNRASDMKVIISPFEETSDGILKRKSAERPSSLPLALSKNNNTDKKTNLDDIFTDKSKSKLKDLASRIKTPGDVPPSVRRNRGKSVLRETRFSLYDDRMMEGISLNDTVMETNVTTQSIPMGIELSGRQQVRSDSSF